MFSKSNRKREHTQKHRHAERERNSLFQREWSWRRENALWLCLACVFSLVPWFFPGKWEKVCSIIIIMIVWSWTNLDAWGRDDTLFCVPSPGVSCTLSLYSVFIFFLSVYLPFYMYFNACYLLLHNLWKKGEVGNCAYTEVS